jgi:hypothetical protein
VDDCCCCPLARLAEEVAEETELYGAWARRSRLIGGGGK